MRQRIIFLQRSVGNEVASYMISFKGRKQTHHLYPACRIDTFELRHKLHEVVLYNRNITCPKGICWEHNTGTVFRAWGMQKRHQETQVPSRRPEVREAHPARRKHPVHWHCLLRDTRQKTELGWKRNSTLNRVWGEGSVGEGEMS